MPEHVPLAVNLAINELRACGTLLRGIVRGARGFSGTEEESQGQGGAMRRILLVVTAVLLVLVLSIAVAGCRKSGGTKGGGYLPAPTRSSVPAAVA
jgi:hypothetical protein